MKIEKQFAILKKQIGWYHAFSTLACKEGIIWLARRSGKIEQWERNGCEGCVRLVQASAAGPDRWMDKGKSFRPSPDGTCNELNANISAPTPELELFATRDFELGSFK